MIDIGANLANESFNQDVNEVLLRAKSAGVEKIIVTGANQTSSRAAKALAALHPGYLYATAGLHPHEADSFQDETIDCFSELLSYDNVVAIGETGLDYNRNFSSRDNQLKSFAAHLDLARSISKPLFLHERDAYSDFVTTMKNYDSLCQRSIVHCFTGDLTALRVYLDLGMYIGITGWICDKKRGKNLRKIIRYAPLDRLMIETDAPYLTPHKEKLSSKLAIKHRNEPWTLSYTATALANSLNTDLATVIETTTNNSLQFFSLN